ncbi:MAG: HPF/RaiA family ribosome-associated protein [Saprospiraceae bacterium]|nr:HPF/RaiA family ribosome-associated protein [Saprospiraceae bacterium]
MDISIEAIGHANQSQLKEYYTNKLTRKYGKYDFAIRMNVKVKDMGKDGYEVSLNLQPENGAAMFARAKHSSENSALSEAMKKLNTQIEKYKEQHYHSSQKINKLDQLDA